MTDLPRPLTEDEIALLKGVFGDGLNYGDIRIDEGGYPKTETRGPTATTRFDTMHFPTVFADFSQEKLRDRAWLVHEAVHVWQWQQFKIDTHQKAHQLGISTWIDYDSAYEWSFADDFSKMNIEQQAQVVQDRYLVHGKDEPFHETDWKTGDPLPPLESYDKLLEPFYARNAKGTPPHRKAYGWDRDEEDGGGFSEEPPLDESSARIEEEREQLRQRVDEIWAVLDTIDPDDPSFDQAVIDDFVDALNAQLGALDNLAGSDLRDRIQDLLARLDQWQDYFDNLVGNVDDAPPPSDEFASAENDWSSDQEEEDEPAITQPQSYDEDRTEQEDPRPDDDPW